MSETRRGILFLTVLVLLLLVLKAIAVNSPAPATVAVVNSNGVAHVTLTFSNLVDTHPWQIRAQTNVNGTPFWYTNKFTAGADGQLTVRFTTTNQMEIWRLWVAVP